MGCIAMYIVYHNSGDSYHNSGDLCIDIKEIQTFMHLLWIRVVVEVLVWAMGHVYTYM